MSTRKQSSQELFWAGEFGADYTERNQPELNDRVRFFNDLMKKTKGVKSICELGANKGHNLDAFHTVNPRYELTGVELNEMACRVMRGKKHITAVNSSIQDYATDKKFDLVYTVGVLIHLNPDDLQDTYQKMYDLSSRYIMMNEYFNPVPVEIPYRGHAGKLFKRDFAGEFMDKFGKNVAVVDYGFLWRRFNPSWDDTTWVLIEKLD